MLVLIVILSFTIILFIWGKFPPDVVAILSMLSLYLSGILDLNATLSGFSNPTVIMIAALFIIGEGLSRTGWTALAGRKFVEWAGKSTPKLLVLLTLGSGTLSGFVSNTGTVATLLPVTVSAAWKAGIVPSKLLIPVAFGSNTGGLLTLTGTPPNIIASNALISNGLKGFSFFEFSLLGLPLLVIVVLYFKYIGLKILPNNSTTNKPVSIDSELHTWIKSYSIDTNIYRLRVRAMSPLINTSIKNWDFEKKHSISIIKIRRLHQNFLKKDAQDIELPNTDTKIQYRDSITVKGTSKAINRLMLKYKLSIIPTQHTKKELKKEFLNHEVGLAQMIITPDSKFIGQTIPLGYYLKHYEIQLLGGSRNNKPIRHTTVKVKAGDAFVIRGTWDAIETLKNVYQNVVISGSPESMAKNVDKITLKSYLSLSILVLLILLLVFKLLPGAIAALSCAGIMMLSGCVPISKAYDDINWTSVIMIAAMIPMGLALQKTGTAKAIADNLVDTLGAIHPIALLGGIFLATSAFSQTINNSATAVLMAPIVILAAQSLGISAKPLMVTLAVSASTAFLTPVGTTTNAMVMGAGNYKFIDYVKVGLPLLILFFITTILLVPLFWPF